MTFGVESATSNGFLRNRYDRKAWLPKLAEAMIVLLNSERKKVSIATVGAFVVPFCRLNQIKVFYGYNDYPSAYITWGYVTTDTIDRLQRAPSTVLDIEDLNAGDNLVIFDIISGLRSNVEIWRFVRGFSQLFGGTVYGVRYSRSERLSRLKKYSPRPLDCKRDYSAI